MSRRAPDERGASIVEFTLVFLLVVMPMIFGIIQYGYHYWALETADAVAREAARSMSVGTEWSCTRSTALDRISGPAIDGSTSVTMSYASGEMAPTVGDVVEVRVEFNSLHLGFLPLPEGGHIDRTAAARVENVPESSLAC